MLIALFTILFLGGSATGMLDYLSDSQDAVKAIMEPDDRRKDALATLKDMEKRTKSRSKAVAGSAKELSRVLGQDDASDAEVDAVWAGYFEQRSDYNNDMLNLRFQLKEQMTREEWEQVFGRE